jgi:hypothetical protein
MANLVEKEEFVKSNAQPKQPSGNCNHPIQRKWHLNSEVGLMCSRTDVQLMAHELVCSFGEARVCLNSLLHLQYRVDLFICTHTDRFMRAKNPCQSCRRNLIQNLEQVLYSRNDSEGRTSNTNHRFVVKLGQLPTRFFFELRIAVLNLQPPLQGFEDMVDLVPSVHVAVQHGIERRVFSPATPTRANVYYRIQ